MKFKTVKKSDIILIFSVVAVCLAVLAFSYFNTDRPVAVITVDGEVYDTVNLLDVEQGYLIEPENAPGVVILVEHGAISFQSSTCEDGLCVNCGKLTRTGMTAACLPKKTVIAVKGVGSVDAVTY